MIEQKLKQLSKEVTGEAESPAPELQPPRTGTTPSARPGTSQLEGIALQAA